MVISDLINYITALNKTGRLSPNYRIGTLGLEQVLCELEYSQFGIVYSLILQYLKAFEYVILMRVLRVLYRSYEDDMAVYRRIQTS